eukprot:m.185513 g.185513  ORF g.185513 m.185513 type:complete len:163 (-) comp32235_c5_seq1:149-637(-)
MATTTKNTGVIVSLADSVKIGTFQPPRFFWFLLSGGLGDAIMFLFDMLLKSMLLPKEYNTPSVCWVIAYTSSISWRHVLHTFIVFGGTYDTLTSHLPRTYFAFSFGIAFSTVMNWILTEHFLIDERVAFFSTLYTTAILNFFVLKKVATPTTTTTTTELKKE